MLQSEDSSVDLVNAEIRIFLSVCVNANVNCTIVNEIIMNFYIINKTFYNFFNNESTRASNLNITITINLRIVKTTSL